MFPDLAQAQVGTKLVSHLVSHVDKQCCPAEQSQAAGAWRLAPVWLVEQLTPCGSRLLKFTVVLMYQRRTVVKICDRNFVELCYMR